MMQLTIEDIKKHLEPCFSSAGANKAILFGSFARGTQTRRSDIDLLVIKETTKRYFDRYDDFRDVYFQFPEYEIEMLIYTPDELERNKDRPFLRRVLKEGIVIYGC